MRAVVQRVSSACVRVKDGPCSEIGKGLVVLVGVEGGDRNSDAIALAHKVVELRVFEDESGRMNQSLLDVGGSILIVSQFTLLGDCRKGRRPSFARAARPDLARELYETVVREIQQVGVRTATGVFQATMTVELENEGPVTLLLDTRKVF